MVDSPPWNLSLDELLRRLGAAPGGLSDQEFKRRLSEYGANDALAHRCRPLWRQTLDRLANPLILILLFASALSAWAGEVTSFVIIVVIILLSVVLDVAQQARAENTVDVLRRFVGLKAEALRDGEVHERFRRRPLRRVRVGIYTDLGVFQECRTNALPIRCPRERRQEECHSALPALQGSPEEIRATVSDVSPSKKFAGVPKSRLTTEVRSTGPSTGNSRPAEFNKRGTSPPSRRERETCFAWNMVIAEVAATAIAQSKVA